MTALVGPKSGHAISARLVDADAFWRLVDRAAADECWEWSGTRNVGGYGAFSAPRVRPGPFPAHRVAYALAHGETPRGLSVMHTCDNPACCNPAHLRVGTHADNMGDAVNKRRHIAVRRRESEYCIRAHKYTATNTHIAVTGARQCRKCMRYYADRRHRKMNRLARREWHRTTLDLLSIYLPATRDALNGAVGERRAGVLSRCIGLFGFRPEGMKTIGRDLGLTGERVRQLRNNALRALGVPPAVIGAIGSVAHAAARIPVAVDDTATERKAA